MRVTDVTPGSWSGRISAPPLLLFVPVVNTADEGRNQSHSRFGARDGLGEAEEQSQIAVNAFSFEPLGGANALPGAGELDENALTADAFRLIQRDEFTGLGDAALGIEAQARGYFGGYAPRNHLQNLASEQHEEAIDKLLGHFLVSCRRARMPGRQLRPPGGDKPASAPRDTGGKGWWWRPGDGAARSPRYLPCPPQPWCISSETPIASFSFSLAEWIAGTAGQFVTALYSSCFTFASRRRWRAAPLNEALRKFRTQSQATSIPVVRPPRQRIFISSSSTPWRAE